REQIEQKGPVPFATFMEWALYHPEWGYYTGERRKFGKEGDFFTSPGVNPVFAEVLADEIAGKWRDGFTVLEFGAGDGRLARDLLSRWQGEAPEVYAGVTYRITETSPNLRALQRETLADHLEKVVWLSEEELHAGAPYRGVVLTNELVDAFPVHRIIGQCPAKADQPTVAELLESQRISDEAQEDEANDTELLESQQISNGEREDQANVAEIYVTWDEDAGRFVERTGPPSDERIARYVSRYCPRLASGQIAEVGLAGLDWYERALGLLAEGEFMTIDYGFEAEMMYHPSRRTGTLRGFHRHTLTTDPYLYIGEQDLTADVNFTALRDIGETRGWQTEFFGSQSKYLLQAGILQRLTDTMGRDPFHDPDQKRNRAIRQMIMPGGMGDHFKVLVQHRPPSVL
ncbi:MAG: SAM-dependent methyltransferase, partial [Tumebacillaceae bacterium]